MKRVLVVSLGASLLVGSTYADEPHPPKSERPGKVFFETKVFPRLADNGCPMCHAVGYVHPNVMVYEQLLPYLAMGDAAIKTPLIRKIANLRPFRPDIPTHPGGQRCPTIQSEPCKSIMEWWGVEFGTTTANSGVSR